MDRGEAMDNPFAHAGNHVRRARLISTVALAQSIAVAPDKHGPVPMSGSARTARSRRPRFLDCLKIDSRPREPLEAAKTSLRARKGDIESIDRCFPLFCALSSERVKPVAAFVLVRYASAPPEATSHVATALQRPGEAFRLLLLAARSHTYGV